MHGVAAGSVSGKEGCMKVFILIVAIALSLTSCHEEEEQNREEARVQAEVTRRVETIRDDLKSSETMWHSVRVACFCILAGGSLIGLMSGLGSGERGTSREQFTSGNNRYESKPGRRVIDRPYDPDYDPEDDPYRH